MTTGKSTERSVILQALFLGGYLAVLTVTMMFAWNGLGFLVLLFEVPPHLVAWTFLGSWPDGWPFPTGGLVFILIAQVAAARWVTQRRRSTDAQKAVRRVSAALRLSLVLVTIGCLIDLVT
ncbi:hypothetical protein AB0B56_08710 [Streptosporangium canum]|uniref:hypothetical protein n=1 Tax=Streptosporangium canum TaxID=324952 RepID=UPI00343FE116